MENSVSKATANPHVFSAARAVGILRPKFQPGQPKVFIDHLEVIGTAFWLRDHKVLVTCEHVVRNLFSAPVEVTGLLVVGNRGQYQRAIVTVVDPEHDLAVLRLDAPAELIESEAKSGLVIATEHPLVGTKVAYAGYPLGNQLLNMTHAPSYAEGVVASDLKVEGHKKLVQVSGPVVGGFSGSAVVATGSDQLVGVLSDSPSVEAGRASIFRAVSWEHVRALALLANS